MGGITLSGTFGGMSSSSTLPSSLSIILCGIFIEILFFLLKGKLEGIGGKLGLIAFFSVLISSFISSFVTYIGVLIGPIFLGSANGSGGNDGGEIDWMDGWNGSCYSFDTFYFLPLAVICSSFSAYFTFLLSSPSLHVNNNINNNLNNDNNNDNNNDDKNNQIKNEKSEGKWKKRIKKTIKTIKEIIKEGIGWIRIERGRSPQISSSFITLSFCILLKIILSFSFLFNQSNEEKLNEIFNEIAISIYCGSFVGMTMKNRFKIRSNIGNFIIYLFCGGVATSILYFMCGIFPGDIGGKAGLSAFFSVIFFIFIIHFIIFIWSFSKRFFLKFSNRFLHRDYLPL